MHLILTPIDRVDLDPIELTNNPSPVGRLEAPFSDYSLDVVGKLSKRHARFFEQEDQVYVADVGSTNGTFINGKQIDTPSPLHDADEINFGDLAFKLRIIGEATEPADEAADLQLMLVPADDAVLEPILVASFPFLINKHSDLFARYRAELGEELGYLSRRHAHFFIRDHDVYIEDLNSTNGTFVNGVRLEEAACKVEDDDALAFGGTQFTYHANIIRPEPISEPQTAAQTNAAPTEPQMAQQTEQRSAPQTEQNTAQQSAPQQEAAPSLNRTVFIDSPTSFVEIYVSTPEQDESDGAAESPSQTATPNRQGVRGTLAFIADLKRAVLGDRGLAKRTRWTISFILLAIVGAGAYLYWQGAQLRNIEELLAQGEFLSAARKADAYLAENPDAADYQKLGTEAAIALYLPPLVESLTDQAYVSAEQALADSRALTTHNTDAQSLIALLEWSIELLAFLNTRAEKPSINQLLNNAGEIERLNSWWENNRAQHARDLLRLVDLNRDFEPVRAEIYSALRQLNLFQRDQAPIDQLRKDISLALQTGSGDDAAAAIEIFAEQNDVTDVDALLEDLNVWKSLRQMTDGGDAIEAYRRYTAMPFTTTPFQQHLQQMIGRSIPDTQTMGAIESAIAAWRAGNASEAIAKLQTLRDTPWSDAVEQLINRFTKVNTTYTQLTQRNADRATRLATLRFVNGLDPDRDRYFLRQLQDRVDAFIDTERASAEASLSRAQSAWRRYQVSGGIQSAQRLETVVSGAYQRRATALAGARDQLADYQASIALIKETSSQTGQLLCESIALEISRQSRAISNLQVLESAVREQKLAALPDPIDC